MNNHLSIRIVLFALATTILTAAADLPSLTEKIIGTWEFDALGKSVQQTFSTNGVYHLVAPNDLSLSATWSIDGDQLTIKMETQNVIAKITKLDDSVLIYDATNRYGLIKSTTWKRVK